MHDPKARSPKTSPAERRLAAISAELERALTFAEIETPALHEVDDVRRETVWVHMRDGVRLATELYLPPVLPAPTVATRTPYGRGDPNIAGISMCLARCGYAVISQDCRGTGESEPEEWDYYVYEPEDSWDLVEWVKHQPWFGGFLGALGASYAAQTQWCMAMHPCASAIVPEVSGLGVAINTARLYLFLNAYSRSVGKGKNKSAVKYDELERQMHQETLAGGYFNEPLHERFCDALLSRYPELRDLSPHEGKRRLWERYCSMSCAQRAELIKQARGRSHVTIDAIESLPAVFGHGISHDRHTLPCTDPAELVSALHAPALMITGWYDWGLNDALETWRTLRQYARDLVREGSRLIVTPSAHNTPGYREGMQDHSTLTHNHRPSRHVDLLLRWYAAVREQATADWPRVIYYLMGANEWQVAWEWPPSEVQQMELYLGPGGTLTSSAPPQSSAPDCYHYDPENPTPTIGGSIVSYVYLPGSCDVSAVHERADVVTYTTEPLEHDLDVVGPVRLILYASSTVVDTDFVGRLSDVFPDGRAIQIQNGALRARYRNLQGEPELLQPGRVYALEIDLWATANRFKAGHRLRLDVSSADFPRFDRNTGRGGAIGPPIPATQTIYHDVARPSRLLLSVLPASCSPLR